MRIAYLARGHDLFDRRFLEKMVERGHKPTLISYFPSEKVRVSGVPVLHYDTTSLLRFPRLTSLQIAWHLRGLLEELNPDVLHTGWVNDCGFYGALSGFHPTLSMPWGSDILIAPELSRSLLWITKFTLKRADYITCDCQVVKNRIIELTGCDPDKVIVFPWGIDLDIFKPSSSKNILIKKLEWENKKILIMTRNFKPIYGIEYFVGAIPLILNAEPDVRVILIGSHSLDKEYSMKIKKMVEEIGLRKFVHFVGYVEENELPNYLNASDIYISTSFSDGTSSSLLEAMACGLPVVVSDAPANYEWVEDGFNGYIVRRKNSDVVAERILRLLGNAELRKEMGERNLRVVCERADWEKNFDILEGIYQNITNKQSSR